MTELETILTDALNKMQNQMQILSDQDQHLDRQHQALHEQLTALETQVLELNTLMHSWIATLEYSPNGKT